MAGWLTPRTPDLGVRGSSLARHECTVTFTFIFTCDISDFKKHNETGPPEQLPTDALSQINYGHTRHCEDCLCQRTTQRAF